MRLKGGMSNNIGYSLIFLFLSFDLKVDNFELIYAVKHNVWQYRCLLSKSITQVKKYKEE